MEKIMISACLAGVNCKYNGGNNLNHKIVEYIKSGQAVLICPEQMGGLPTPRPASEIKKDKVVNTLGDDITRNFEQAAAECVRLAELYGIKKAILKERSPSCGVHEIYDGSFCGVKVKGMGITARRLKEHGVRLISEEDL